MGSNAVCAATICLIAPREDAANNYDRYRDALLVAARELSDKVGNAPLRLANSGVA